MNYLFFVLIFLTSGCAQLNVFIDGQRNPQVKLVKHEKYWKIQGAENSLRKTSEATLAISFYQQRKTPGPQDLIAISVGGVGNKSLTSRASLRIDGNGHLMGIARSLDSEAAQNIVSDGPIRFHGWNMAVLTIDYAKNEMLLYLNGRLIKSHGDVHFAAQETSDTPSLSAAIGSEDDGSTFYFEGKVRDPMVYRRKLDRIQVRYQYKPYYYY
jgi:hypothetical protein